MPALDVAGAEAHLKPKGSMLMASHGDAPQVDPHDAGADDRDIAELVDWIARETTIKIVYRWRGLRSFVAGEALVVGFDAQAPNFFWRAGQGG